MTNNPFEALLESHKIRDEGRILKSLTVDEAFYDLQKRCFN